MSQSAVCLLATSSRLGTRHANNFPARTRILVWRVYAWSAHGVGESKYFRRGLDLAFCAKCRSERTPGNAL